eukprot:TRINITY_DN6616_c0_g1_i1.p2 TRINITY_DN6616_c0_g1~~TRINITY_DN6616_c0_g1_i1.p2  ORF type:complete len:136 (-),score=18.79 TRINITY_DN6616_c0_g1_i1:370-777(-)
MLSGTAGAEITYSTSEQAARYPSVVGTKYTEPVSLTSTMGQTSTAVASTVGMVNLTAIASKDGWADSDTHANLFTVSHLEEWSSSNGVEISEAAEAFIRSGLKCEDVLVCVSAGDGDDTPRTAKLELATGDCYCE